MTTVATLWVELGLDSSKYHKGLTDATNSTSGLGGVMRSVGNIAGTVLKAGLLAGAAGAVALGKGLFDSVQAAAEAQDVQAQLNAVLESTGGVAGVTADEVNRLADTLSGVTKFEDEAIISGENLLLTFTNIGKDIFPEATEVMLDMSQALGQDLKSSAIQLGKALQDPVLGVTALRRVGVNFNDEQKKMIESMVEAGDVAGAQAFILKELQTEFGGSARAAGETFGGQLEILKNKLGNVKEEIGAALLPMLTNMAKQFNEFLASPEFQARLKAFTDWIVNEAVPWIENKLIPAVEKFVLETIPNFVQGLKTWLEESKKDIDKWGNTHQEELTAVGTEFQTSKDKIGEILTLLGFDLDENGKIAVTWESILGFAVKGVTLWFKWLNWALENFINLGYGIIAAADAIGRAFEGIALGVRRAYEAVVEFFGALPAYTSIGSEIRIEELAPISDPPGFASGGSFTVPPGFSGDSFPMRVSSGEQVSVTPPGQSNNGGMSDQQLKTLAKYMGMEFAKVMG